ncbi:MAG: nucleotidyltransferase substrate binding protein [Gammaproteobacteria bacterium]|nr:nucleotidyltransferase substrate binding protein [Gammaproteobacteria bacterium]MBU2056280.1 nucleotidyltransferase substrate binding protein [Gammaproteobacteria bacterium]MBU2174695.1 nucleotidyltransferase substrate binding protein [Gammaproteobacteria bacterium]MBU2248856.1 nucleotidyltransferase substrate binding protein [Gammaproteobacteria bacterium]MBU2344563.1 nucleotidyltransferase substrate binding protein [Gammaproteobacteria bacterium]
MLYLNVDHLRRCIQTLASSLALYQKAEAGSIDQEVFRNAIVKGYELTQETAFKLLKKALKAFGHGGKKLETTPVKDILRLAAVHGLLTLDEVERWFRYRDNRNNTAHDYGEQFATETLVLIPVFLQDITTLADTLERKLGQDATEADDGNA